jgi:hypothetical protein
MFGSFLSGVHSLTRADKIEGYDHFYDDYCIAHYLLGLVTKHIAFFPDEVHDSDMCAIAIRSFNVVFRYAPYIKDDTYAYYFSHYNLGLIMMHQGYLDQAEEKFKYLLSTINPTLMGLPALVAGKGRNSLEVLILAKAHAGLFLLLEDRQNAASQVEGRTAHSSVSSTSVSRSSSSSNGKQEHVSRPPPHHLPARMQVTQESLSSDFASLMSTGSTTKLNHDFKAFPVVVAHDR